MESVSDRLILLRVAAFPFESLEKLRAATALERLDDWLALEEEAEGEVGPLSEALFAAAGPPVPGDSEHNRRRLAIVTLRRAVYNRRRPASALLDEAGVGLDPALRERVGRQVELRQRLQELHERYQDVFSSELRACRNALLQITNVPLFGEGIRLVSRSLFEALGSLRKTDPSRWDYDDRHVASKFASYAARGAAKTSPYSVFCATALVQAGPGPARVSGENLLIRREILLNIFEARKVASCLAADPAVRSAAGLRPNPTLRTTEGGWTYWRPAVLRSATDQEVLSRARDLPVLHLFLDEAADAARGALELVRIVAERTGAEERELAGFLEKLVESGIFIHEVEIPYCCRRPLESLGRACRRSGSSAPWIPEVEAIEQQVDELSALPPAERSVAMDRIQERLERLPHVRDLKEDEIFRLDAASGLQIALPASVVDEVQEAVEWYARLFASLYPETLLRAGYVRRFLQVHPPDKDVELLDLYHGLFEPEPAQRPISFPEPSGEPSSELTQARRRFHRARDAFAGLARAANENGAEEILLTNENWRKILEEASSPPWFCGALFQVEAARPEEVASGEARLALNALFSGSGLASARLDHLHAGGPDAAESPIALDVRRGWGRLEREGAILAEVTYMHWGRTANAGLRPSIFRHEIELPGEKASEGAEVIPLRQLVVRYDSERKRFVLRWMPKGLEVIPVVGSGISPEGFVSFLVSLGQQGFQPLTCFAGFDVEGITCWPRFTWKRTILFRRRWIVSPETLPPALADSRASEAHLFASLARLRRRHRLPRHLFVHTSVEPKPFYSDLESPVLVELIRRAASSREDRPAPTLYLTEMLPSPEGLWVCDRNGRYASEFLVQLHGPAQHAGLRES
ncbi:MAG TPA: lantibiotic dehydratase [Candidatus Polarisedimenticolia bacterium]|nr:lantibiotic dehydratase [Candidatus Polarisedimenticolia bacterium]